jgi:NAD(P)-dependent dehydrogenase (short-subunit alcohol dehydrogenase family)
MPLITIDMTGTVVAITGAGGNIGSAIAQRFAAASASVVLQTNLSEPPAIEAAGGTSSVRCDLSTPTGPDEVVAGAVEAFGKLDVVINNAGIQPVAEFMDIDDDEWDAMLATNLTACHRLTRSFAQHVIERTGTGSVVHIASIEGTHPAVGHSHYSTSKAALIMHAKASAVELGPSGIRVNSVSPGLIEREGIEDAWPEGVQRWNDAAPLGRLGRGTDIGDACVFLSSSLAPWITGVDLVVDGGVASRNTW